MNEVSTLLAEASGFVDSLSTVGGEVSAGIDKVCAGFDAVSAGLEDVSAGIEVITAAIDKQVAFASPGIGHASPIIENPRARRALSRAAPPPVPAAWPTYP